MEVIVDEPGIAPILRGHVIVEPPETAARAIEAAGGRRRAVGRIAHASQPDGQVVPSVSGSAVTVRAVDVPRIRELSCASVAEVKLPGGRAGLNVVVAGQGGV